MQRMTKWPRGLLVLLLATGLAATAPVWQVDFYSSYIWRGFDLNPEHKPVLQPSVTFSVGDSGLAVNLWSSFSFADKNLNEIDCTVSYGLTAAESVAVTFGFTHYGWYFADNFKFKTNTSQEVFLSLGLLEVPLKPTASVYYDFNQGDGWYLSLGITRSVAIESLSMDLGATLGYNAGQWLAEGADTGISDIHFGASLPLKTGGITIVPSLHFSWVLLDSVSLKDHFWAGVSVVF